MSGPLRLYVGSNKPGDEHPEMSQGRCRGDRMIIRMGSDPVGRTHAVLHEFAHFMTSGYHDERWEEVAVHLYRLAKLDPEWVKEREEFYGRPIREWAAEAS